MLWYGVAVAFVAGLVVMGFAARFEGRGRSRLVKRLATIGLCLIVVAVVVGVLLVTL